MFNIISKLFKKEHNCKDVISKVTLCLDGQLSSSEEQKLLKRMEECSYCFEKYEIEKSFKDFLVNKIKQKKVSSSVIQSIKDKINAGDPE